MRLKFNFFFFINENMETTVSVQQKQPVAKVVRRAPLKSSSPALTTVPSTPVSVPTPVPVSTSSSSVQKQRSDKNKKPVERPEERPEERPVERPSEEVPTESTDQTTREQVEQRFKDLIDGRLTTISNAKNEIVQLKNTQRLVLKNLKKKKNVSKSGFDIPLRVSEVMYRFLERYQVQGGEMLTRNQVKNFIFRYIKEHDLQTQENRKFFKPDQTLTRLFSPDYEKNSAITIMKAQAYYNHHFIKTPKV